MVEARDGLARLALRGARRGAGVVGAGVRGGEVVALGAVGVGGAQGRGEGVGALGVLGVDGGRVAADGLAVGEGVGGRGAGGVLWALVVVLPAVVGDELGRAVEVGGRDALDVGVPRVGHGGPVALEPLDGAVGLVSLAVAEDDGLVLVVLVLEREGPELLHAAGGAVAAGRVLR